MRDKGKEMNGGTTLSEKKNGDEKTAQETKEEPQRGLKKPWFSFPANCHPECGPLRATSPWTHGNTVFLLKSHHSPHFCSAQTPLRLVMEWGLYSAQ